MPVAAGMNVGFLTMRCQDLCVHLSPWRRHRNVRAVTGLYGAGALAVLDRLAIRALKSPLESAETPVFVLATLRGVDRADRLDR